MFFRYHILAIIWGCIIFIAISIPGNSVPRFSFFKDLPVDKIVHFILFFIFSALLAYGLVKQYFRKNSRYKPYVIAFLISISYGAFTELLQGMLFVGRSCEIYDFMSNAAGTIFGLTTFVLLKNKLVGKAYSN